VTGRNGETGIKKGDEVGKVGSFEDWKIRR
jgi:hypothetical protein